MKSPIITICSSVHFYKMAIEVQGQLQESGLEVIVPQSALKMHERNDFDVEKHKTWYQNEADYTEKARLMRDHFDEVTKGDVTLVLNYEKRGQPNYIGGNVLMEMALAFYLKKPIYLINDIPEDSPFVEEIKGMGAIPLHGNLEDMITQLTRGST